MLRRALKGVLSVQESDSMVSAFDQIGSIIIIRIPAPLYHKRIVIGKALLDNVKVADRVFCQVSDVIGDYRIRNLERIAGCGGTTTTYRENGCIFLVDVENVFFSPRLSTERGRIAAMAKDGETVVNMFGGLGIYSIQIAKKRSCIIYNVDINPYATKMCMKNINLNRMSGAVIPVTCDAKRISNLMSDISDRTLMPLPESVDEFLDCAMKITRSGGIIHYYSHIHADKKQDAASLSEDHLKNKSPVDIRIIGSRLVRAVGPRYYQTVVDAEVKK